MNRAAQDLGRMAAGKPKRFSAAEIARRTARIQKYNAERKTVNAEGIGCSAWLEAIATLEAALADEKRAFEKAREHKVAAFMWEAINNGTTLTRAVEILRRKVAIASNDKVSDPR